MKAAALDLLTQSKANYKTMDNKRNRRPHNDTLGNMFKDILNSYTINWKDGTATTKSPAGQIVTYKNK